MLDQKIYELRGKIQHYAWGGYRFLPELLGVKNPENKPFAEYWMGAHDQVPSDIVPEDGNLLSLNAFIAQNPSAVLGKDIANTFGKLPYLFKVLDVKTMLSIQVHPTKTEAKKGFAKEEAAGIPLSDPKRNYKDENHKPEVMVALSEFWLLHGFKDEKSIMNELNRYPAWHILKPVLTEKGIEGLYNYIMTASRETIDALLAPIAKEILPKYHAGEIYKADPAFWAARAIELYSGGEAKNLDRGIFSIYFFNLLRLNEGEAIFQGAGIPHAYLEGRNMELMANSDNVLRGGLTPKYIDVPELLRHTSFEPVYPSVWIPQEKYPDVVPDFSIAKVELPANESRSHTSSSAEIIFVLSGALEITAGAHTLQLHKGGAAFVISNTTYSVQSNSGTGVYFIAGAGKQ